MMTKGETPGIDGATAASYWQKNERRARLTALGIAVLIGALALPIVLSETAEGLGAGLYMLGVAIGCMLIIGPRLGHTGHKHRRVPIAKATRQLAKQELQNYQRAHTIGLTFGIGMCIASIVPAAALGNNFGAALFMVCVAIGVFFLVYVSLVNGGYRRLTHERARLR